MEHGFGFNTIWVIESVPDGERKTGKEIYDDVLTFKQIKDGNFLIEFREVNNRIGLFGLLEQIMSKLKETGHVPLLHFDMHGNTEGFQLKSGEFILYEEMLPFLRPINILTQHNLFLIVAACNGAYLAMVLRNSLSKPAPFWGILGPDVEIYPADVIKGYSAFYDEALSSGNMNSALDKLKQVIPHQAKKFRILNSEYLFILAFKGYIAKYCTPKAIRRRLDDMKKSAKAERGIILSEAQCELIKHQLGSRAGQQKEFEKWKARFFLHDRYQNNRDLPDPSFDLILDKNNATK